MTRRTYRAYRREGGSHALVGGTPQSQQEATLWPARFSAMQLDRIPDMTGPPESCALSGHRGCRILWSVSVSIVGDGGWAARLWARQVALQGPKTRALAAATASSGSRATAPHAARGGHTRWTIRPPGAAEILNGRNPRQPMARQQTTDVALPTARRGRGVADDPLSRCAATALPRQPPARSWPVGHDERCPHGKTTRV